MAFLPIILSHARKRAAGLTDLQSGRLRHDFQERIERSVHDFRRNCSNASRRGRGGGIPMLEVTIPGTGEALCRLAGSLSLHVITADTFSKAREGHRACRPNAKSKGGCDVLGKASRRIRGSDTAP